MAYRSSRSDFDDRDYPPGPPRRGPPPPREYDDVEFYERRERRSSPPPAPRRAPVREYDDLDVDVQIRERERVERTPAFLREDARPTEAGPLVLRQREVETVDRRRPRSPSPVRFRERIVERERERAPSVPPMRRPRFIERSPSPPPTQVRVESRVVERRRERSPSPPPQVRVESRVIERRRERSPSPDRERELIHLHIERERERERIPSPSPSPPPPPPPPPVVRGPTIEREVITHYRDIDHGIERVKPPTPPPPPRPAPSRTKERETDIDIYTSRNETDIDIHKRTRSRSRPRERPRPAQRPSYYDDDDIVIHKDRNALRISETRRRAQSAAPRPDWDDEGEYITSKIDSRGRMGEAYHGATKDWTIVDVPPGTERVKMDGVGGGGAEVSWQRYNGVRRSKFIAEREGAAVSNTTTTVSEPVRDRGRERSVSRDHEHLSVQVYNGRDKSRERETEVEEVRDRRITIRDGGDRPPARKRNEMWTEITKDLVVREAIERMGHEYEETEFFFYVMQYLRYEDVLELVKLSDDIRRARRRRAREIEWEREYRDTRDHERRSRKSTTWDKVDDERIVEREVIYDRGPRYLR